jgi:hypothetical protein
MQLDNEKDVGDGKALDKKKDLDNKKALDSENED